MRTAGVVSAVIVSLGLLAVASPANRAHASEGEPPAWTVSTNPVRFAILHFQVEVERALGDRVSLFVAPIAFHHATWYPFATSDDTTANGFGLDVGARYYSREFSSGWFAGPYLSAYRGAVDEAGVRSLEGYVYSLGFQGGYSIPLGRWVLSGGGGPSYGFATEDAPAGSPKASQLPHRGFWLNFRLNAGLAF